MEKRLLNLMMLQFINLKKYNLKAAFERAAFLDFIDILF